VYPGVPLLGIIMTVPSLYPKHVGLVKVTLDDSTVGASFIRMLSLTGIATQPVGVYVYVIL